MKPAYLKKGSGASRFAVNSRKVESAPPTHRKWASDTQLRELVTENTAVPLIKIEDEESEKTLTSLEKEVANLISDYGVQIDRYLKNRQEVSGKCLENHEITPAVRAKMADWMIEVLNNFRSEDQTYYLAIGIMDRYFREKKEKVPVSQLHSIGVACMFIASKFEDIYPLKMNMVYEKVVHKKMSPEDIIAQEQDILTTLQYRIAVPTSYEFLTSFSAKVFEKTDENREDIELIEKMALYLSKMTLHDYKLCEEKASLQAASSLYVAVKICEQLRKKQMMDATFVRAVSLESSHSEEEITECAQKILHNAQNFDKLFPGLENLKKTHFVKMSGHMNS